MTIQKINKINDLLRKTGALMNAADHYADAFQATDDTKGEYETFAELFYMAFDTFRELKAEMEVE